MKNIKEYFNIPITFIFLIAMSFIIQGLQSPQDRDALFQQAFNDEKNRIMSLPAYEEGHNRFMQFLNEIEQYKAEKIKEMHQDQKYQKNFATIKEEIKKSGTLQSHNLSNAECNHLMHLLNNQFFPE